ncbi:DUF4403 family protein [Flavobacterium ardleyense]|uniref:DUF4403 family protein n=1 Tax=Flavobacterium ardleyense TaxID=2038737 RepID=UPI00298C8F11|nr:DUF4403 family protein [Flavobacterium ardleyense]
MRSTLYILCVFVFSLSLNSCGTTGTAINALRPTQETAPSVYESTTSFINLPIKIRVQDIENQINQSLNGLIYEDSNIEDDDISMKVWKQMPIKLKSLNGKIQILLPLKAEVQYRIGTEALGIKMYDVRKYTFNGTVTLLSEIALTNWQMRTKTEFQSLDFNESPTVLIAGKNIPITYIIKPAISLFRNDIVKSLDESITKSMDFKANVLDALEKVATPFEMDAVYESWLRIVPIELYTTEAVLQKDLVNLEMGLKCNIQTYIGKKPATVFDKNAIVLKPVKKMPNSTTANIAAVSTYKDASRVLTKNFAGQEFGSGGKKVIVKNVEIWHKDKKLIIALTMDGSIKGQIYLSGYPQFNAQTNEIFFDQLDYVLDTKSQLARTANWLASGYILEKIRENCRYSIAANLEDAKTTMKGFMSGYKPMPGVVVNGDLRSFEFEKLQLTNSAIIAFLKVQGRLDISIDGLE